MTSPAHAAIIARVALGAALAVAVAGSARADPALATSPPGRASLALLPGGPRLAQTAPAPDTAAGAPAEEPRSDAAPGEPPAAPESTPESKPTSPPPAEPTSLDFDLLGEAKPPPESANAGALRLRRKMLTVHQGIGLGLVGLQLATTVVGQLNYSDKFGGDQTDRYRLTHKALAYSTLGVFAVNGLIALLAPSPNTPRKLDRVMLHRIAMFTAAAGMVTQGILGVATRERVGYVDQERFATAHLAVGYVTLAAVAVGVTALVF